jgi:hypothetical protein
MSDLWGLAMNRGQDNEFEVPFGVDKVFDAFITSINSLDGFKINSQNKLTHTISVKTGMTLMTWGENISISLFDSGENKTRVKISSSAKANSLLAGNKNAKNITRITDELAKHLS